MKKASYQEMYHIPISENTQFIILKSFFKGHAPIKSAITSK